MYRVIIISLFLATHLFATPNHDVPFENIGGFIAGTIVHTFQGPDTIQNIRVNDRLLSFDPNSGKIIHSRVKEVFQEQIDELVKIIINDEEFYVNPDHRFYIADTHEWIHARNLTPNKHVLLSKEGKHLAINQVELIGGRTYIYDLTVEDTENYFVGKQQVLVHNFAVFIPIFTWVIGEGVALLSLTTLATIAVGTACKYGIEFITKKNLGDRYQKPDNRGLNRYSQPDNYILSRSTNNLKPDADAQGDHTTFKTGANGRIKDGNYATWRDKEENLHPKDPHRWENEKRYDGKGASHNGIETPHVHEGKRVRPPKKDEIPKN